MWGGLQYNRHMTPTSGRVLTKTGLCFGQPWHNVKVLGIDIYIDELFVEVEA